MALAFQAIETAAKYEDLKTVVNILALHHNSNPVMHVMQVVLHLPASTCTLVYGKFLAPTFLDRLKGSECAEKSEQRDGSESC